MSSPTASDIMAEIDRAYSQSRAELLKHETPQGYHQVNGPAEANRYFFLQSVCHTLGALRSRLRSFEFAEEISSREDAAK